MAHAIFTTSESTAYDDQPEVRYHFPRTYLSQAKAAVGDLIVYYEPRRAKDRSDASGRQSYFALARVDRIERDGKQPDHYYAYVSGYLEFDRPVPFRYGDRYYESGLRKADGSTNKGAFGRSVRLLPDEEFNAIIAEGFTKELEPWEQLDSAVGDGPSLYSPRPLISTVVTRPFRDVAFRRHVRDAYDNTCAVSRLRLINGGGRPEVQAAHIVPVEEQGPDSVRNGIALTGTLHWLFDRGLISVSDDYQLLVASNCLPADLERLIPTERKLFVPHRAEHRPHRTFLDWHRRNRFKG